MNPILNNALFNALFHSGAYGVAVTDIKGKWIECNETTLSLLGYGKEDFYNLSWSDIAYSDDIILFKQKFNDIISKTKDNDRSQLQLIRKNGTHFPVNLFISPLYNESNVIIGVSVVFAENKWIEVAIKENELRFQQIAENSSDFIWEVDSSGLYTYCNEKITEILGYSPDEVVGHKYFYDFFVPEFRDELKTAAFSVFALKQSFRNFSNPNIHKNGRTVILETSGSPILDKNENLIGYRGADTDITQRILAEQDLKREKAFMDKLFDSSPEAISVSAENGLLKRVNAKFLELFGFSKEEVLNKKIDDLIARDQYFDEAVTLSKETHDGKTTELESVRFRKDRTPIDVSIIAIPITLADRFIGGYGIYRDITQRKNAEKALKESEERFRSLYENVSIGLYRTTPGGEILYANPALISILGFTCFEELAQHNLNQEEYNPDYPRSEFLQQMEREGIIKGLESKWKRHDGNVIYIRESAKAFRDESGKIKYFEGTIEDITERKLSELLLTKQTKELTELNATKDKFFSIISHDLKNPFNTILGFSDVLISNFKDFDNNEILRYIKTIENSSKQAYSLLENLLLWARSQTGTIEFQPKVFDLQKSVSEVIELLDNQAKKKCISIAHNPATRCFAFADKNMIDTILRNLLTNAIKFTPQNGCIVLSTSNHTDHVEIAVRDNGVGISKEDIEYIFNIDRKTTTAGTEREKGNGLGLILCKEFVAKHGGRIRVESEPGRGSVFAFTIPLLK